jgi:hypothetical protein
MRVMLSREDAEDILQAEKIVTIPVRWEPVKQYRWKLEVKVFLPERNEKLVLL